MTDLDTSSPTPAAGSAESTAKRRLTLTPVTALAALVALAAVVALFFGVRWVLAVNDDGLELAAQRDAVLVDARQAAINFNTLDYQNVAAGLDLWEQSSTGTLRDEFRANRADYQKVVEESHRATAATAQDGAVTELDLRSGSARALIAIDVEIRPENQDPVVTRQRLQLEMTRTDQGWKASRVIPVRNPS